MTKRFHTTVPDMIGNIIERWSEHEGSRPSSLASFLLETVIREKLKAGEIPKEWAEPRETKNYETLAELVKRNFSTLIDTGKFKDPRLKALINDNQPTEVELLRIALILGLSEDYLLSLWGNNGKKELGKK